MLEIETLRSTRKGRGGTSKKRWDNADVNIEFAQALHRIASAPIRHVPFPHFVVEKLFSQQFYKELMKELPPASQYKVQRYAGTHSKKNIIQLRGDGACTIPKDCSSEQGRGVCYHKTVRLHDRGFQAGRILTAQATPSRYPFWLQAFRFVHSVNFTSLLTSKLSLPGGLGIPPWKRTYIAGASLRNAAALRIEPTEYHLTPHIDLAFKVITWQLFHPTGKQLARRQLGTFFYRPKKGLFTMDDKANPPWLDYSLFDTVLEHPVLPNYFFAFAPNKLSFHGANITRGNWIGEENTMQRRTFLGFITSKKSKIHNFNDNDWVDEDYLI